MNLHAAKGLEDVLRTNLGPKGTVKMLVGGAGGAWNDAEDVADANEDAKRNTWLQRNVGGKDGRRRGGNGNDRTRCHSKRR